MSAHSQVSQRPSNRFWGLGWGMFYLASGYLVLLLLEICLGVVAGWVYWSAFLSGAVLSAFVLIRADGTPKGIFRSLFYAVHLLNLGFGILGAVFGLIYLLSHGTP